VGSFVREDHRASHRKSLWIIFALGAALLTSINPIVNQGLWEDNDVSVVTWVGQALMSTPKVEI
jgi:hypothetical protein